MGSRSTTYISRAPRSWFCQGRVCNSSTELRCLMSLTMEWTRKTRTNPARRRLSYVLLFAATLVAALSYPAVNQARGGAATQRPPKLDRVLRRAAATGDTSPQRVIVRTRAGRSASVADRLAKHGDRIEARHRRLESLTALVHGGDLLALEADPDVEAVSVDAVITADSTVEQGRDDADAQLENVLVSALGLSDTGVRWRQGRSRGHRFRAREERRPLRRACGIDSSISRPTARRATHTMTTATAHMSRR